MHGHQECERRHREDDLAARGVGLEHHPAYRKTRARDREQPYGEQRGEAGAARERNHTSNTSGGRDEKGACIHPAIIA